MPEDEDECPEDYVPPLGPLVSRRAESAGAGGPEPTPSPAPGPVPFPGITPRPIPGPGPRPVPVEEEVENFSFPKNAGTQSFGIGSAILDFRLGTAVFIGGSGQISDQLKDPNGFVRSFFIEPDQDVIVLLGGRAPYTCPANVMTGFIFAKYFQAEIRTTAVTLLKVYASTDPRGGLVRG